MITLFRRPLIQISSRKRWFTTFFPHWVTALAMERNTPEFMGEDSNDFFCFVDRGKTLPWLNVLTKSWFTMFPLNNRTEQNSLKKSARVPSDVSISHTEAGVPLGSLISGVWSALIGRQGVSVDPLIRTDAKHISKQVIWTVPFKRKSVFFFGSYQIL